MKPATMLSMLVLAMVAIGHLLRFVLGVEIRVGGILVPLWVSVIACVVPAGLVVGLGGRVVTRKCRRSILTGSATLTSACKASSP